MKDYLTFHRANMSAGLYQMRVQEGGEEMERLVDELQRFCHRGEISVEALRERINSTPQNVIKHSPLGMHQQESDIGYC